MGCGPSTIAGESQGQDILNDIDRDNVLALGNSPPTTSDEPFASVNENLMNKEIEVLEGDSNIAEAQKQINVITLDIPEADTKVSISKAAEDQISSFQGKFTQK